MRGEAKATAEQILAELQEQGAGIPQVGRDAAKKRIVDTVFWRMVLTQIVDGELANLGAVAVADRTTPDGKPLLVLRTAFTAQPAAPDSCVGSLLRVGVRHIVNLYAGPMPTAELEAAEARAVLGAGGTYFTARDHPEVASFRDELRESEGPDAAKAAMQAIADLIRSQILAPQGQAPRGHVQVHCGGGMHRTGMVIGVLERCWNRTPWAEVAAHYRRHVGWLSDREPGGFEEKNLEFIEKFDCSLLRP